MLVYHLDICCYCFIFCASLLGQYGWEATAFRQQVWRRQWVTERQRHNF